MPFVKVVVFICSYLYGFWGESAYFLIILREVISIFIEPPGDNITEKKEVLEERLKLRSNTPVTLVKKRLKRLDLELEYKENFQHHYINYDLEETTNEIENTIKEQLNK